jgi:hypothetical protein
MFEIMMAEIMMAEIMTAEIMTVEIMAACGDTSSVRFSASGVGDV